jgi:BioD-like phosphotransacetylase family protein
VQTSDSTKDSIEIKFPEAGERRDGTAKQPENFGAIISRYQMITQQATEVLRLQLRPRCDHPAGN